VTREPGTVLGVGIPTLDEAPRLASLLEDLRGLNVPYRVVVADGASVDGTRGIARRGGATVLESPPGRARQLNAAAAALDTPWLLFLHADSRLPTAALREVERWIERPPPGTAAAYFPFRLQGEDWFWRFIEFGQRLRERGTGLVYGDQGLLLPTPLFRKVGGFPDLPLMEDVEMVRLLRHHGEIQPLKAPLLTSPRRYRETGRWRGWMRNTALISLHLAGVPPNRLARCYPPSRGKTSPPTWKDTLLVFAKAPVEGRVKTRLAQDVGAPAATRYYRALARRVVDQVRGGEYRIRICFDPPGALETVQEWLGPLGVEFRPQSPGTLGDRMHQALAGCKAAGGRACVIGTDAPGVHRALVEEAFFLLEDADVVFGPALDGGYYLLALRRPDPELFRGIPWSTPRVLQASLDRARAAGLRVALLPPLPDMDTHADLLAAGEELQGP